MGRVTRAYKAWDALGQWILERSFILATIYVWLSFMLPWMILAALFGLLLGRMQLWLDH